MGDSALADPRVLAGRGWALQPIGDRPPGQVDARWQDTPDRQGDDGRPGLHLRLGAGTGSAVWLQLRHQPQAAVQAHQLVIEVPEGVQAVLVETHEREAPGSAPPQVQQLQTRLQLGDGASLRHLRIVLPGAGDQVTHQLHARLGRGARYEQALLASGCVQHLQRCHVSLPADGAQLRLAGLLFAAGNALDQQVRVAHEAPHTTSQVEGLVLARGAARAALEAYTRIAPGAREAAVRQRLAGIPTGGQPRVQLRPHLEIHHDQVQAAHGATWGELPQDALFYARQRGLDEAGARGLIVQGMATALLERALGGAQALAPLALPALITRLVATHLGAGGAAQEHDHG